MIIYDMIKLVNPDDSDDRWNTWFHTGNCVEIIMAIQLYYNTYVQRVATRDALTL